MPYKKHEDSLSKAKRGPVPSGDTRSEIERRSAKKIRQQKIDAGLLEIKTFVTEDTKATLQIIKQEIGLGSLGEVIDYLAKSWKND